MNKFIDRISSLDDEHSIWVEENELGAEKAILHNNKPYLVRIPKKINNEVTLRLRGLGKKRGNKTGDLLLHVWLNKGKDVRENLWISDSAARNGAEKRLMVDGKAITIVVPPRSHNGLTIRLKGGGREAGLDPRAPALPDKKRGDALVKLKVYPVSIRPNYGSFEALSTDDMALEGWVYRKIDEVINKEGRSFFASKPLTAEAMADLMNGWGWRRIFQVLVAHLNLGGINLELNQSNSIPRPGICEGMATIQNNVVVGTKYKITINEQFLDNPFSIAAILAHELCHVLYSEKIENRPITAGYVLKSDKATLEEERTVDLLVFMFKIGEFQLRVARDKRLTLGYFNQEVFERIQVIVARKLKSA